MSDWFVERREVRELIHQPSGLRVQPPLLERGYAARREVRGGVEQVWSEVVHDALPAGALPGEVASGALALLAPGPALVEGTGALEDGVRRLVERAREAGAVHLDVLLREVDQYTLFANEERQVLDRRRYALIELKAHGATPTGTEELWRCAAYPDAARLHSALPELESLVEHMVRQLHECTPIVPCPTGALPVVFPPGSASGCFFHEVCGHPLEGDVVARGGSYLAHRLGQRVAEPFVSISDDPTDGDGALAYGWDDEGNPSRPVPLIHAGVVGSPLLDGHSARALGHAPNGHGRRVGYKHPPLPRMAHTRVEPHQGDLQGLLAGVPHGLLVRHMTPRHMNLLSGDFSFYVVEAQEIRDGRLGHMVSPGILSGNGLEALAGIDAVGADSRNLFATRGCRKLDHGPLPVSFGQPAVRFQRLYFRPWR
ncbi:TldD/PmbA family protein [Archangium sp. Cb G35]|uniref:TldD/PmbA family protein n=1 Tax=Archangium sp. Cb G35 TaxID=1920190 RepID=UPI000A4D292B|nr:metallopeptidase TldD-related protein [Archangium sp. Cb G35]